MRKVLVEDGYKKVSPGLRPGLNVFRKDHYALSFNASWQKWVNTDKLTALQTVTTSFYYDAIVATDGEASGYLGHIGSEDQFRLSTAWSIYPIPAVNFKERFRFSQDLNSLLLAPKVAECLPFGIEVVCRDKSLKTQLPE